MMLFVARYKEDIAACFQDYVNNEIEDCFLKSKSLVLSVIRMVLNNAHEKNCMSQEKVQVMSEEYANNIYGHGDDPSTGDRKSVV